MVIKQTMKKLVKKPENDGVYVWDLNNNKSLYLSVYEAVKICNLEHIDKYFYCRNIQSIW